MDLSYTQNMEDYHLWLAFGGRREGTYIDIGAGHPVADNVSFFFYERGWRGIVVEPQPRLLDLYGRIRPRDVAVAALIGTQRGLSDFHVFDKLHGLSTTSAQHAQAAQALGASFTTRKVPTMTLADLCIQQTLAVIDFLKVDVEGAEADVLRSGDWNRFRPRAVVVEAIAPGSNEPSWQGWEPFLLAQGYRFMLFDTLNRFYVAEEQPDLAAHFPRERAPWDCVRHMYEIGRAPENAKHPEHALTKVLARGFWSALPFLDRELIADLLERGRSASSAEVVDAALASLEGEEFRARLGRIACGYDGGQIYPDDQDAASPIEGGSASKK
ncbi:MAG TPA: FkbM family methyltransferase [Pseudolabrys sp.]|nr:FkbM family methyltransferase [Pseudolabrys sp.]